MEFKNKTRRRKKRSIHSFQSLTDYALPLMMYNQKPPQEEMALEEFERFAVDRLKRKESCTALLRKCWPSFYQFDFYQCLEY